MYTKILRIFQFLFDFWVLRHTNTVHMAPLHALFSGTSGRINLFYYVELNSYLSYFKQINQGLDKELHLY